MGQKLVIGPFNRGLRDDVTAFNIDNDSFPTLTNAYQWRGRIKRKRGTSFLGRLTRFFNSNTPYGLTASINLVAGAANLLTDFGLQTGGNLVPGSVVIFVIPTNELFSDNGLGLLTGDMGGTGTVNYATSDIFILGGGVSAINITIRYFPNLPVMGLEELNLDSTQFPGTLAFDTVYSYNIQTTDPYAIYDVSFYKNPIVDGLNLPLYVPKTPVTGVTPTSWNGEDYQQFWTVNYEGALWATNGIKVPFDASKVGMQYAPTVDITYVGNTATALTVTIANSPLVVGDFVFVNEWTGVNKDTLNFHSGYVTAAAPNTPPLALKTIEITFPFAALVGPFAPGIIQYLTNRSDVTRDCLRWYDGDPTNQNPITPFLTGNKGWVNFAPPLSKEDYSVSGLPPDIYYLVGARMIVPFKDRLLFLGAVVQTAAVGSAIYLPDTIVYSQNGTPYYTASFTGDPTLADTLFHPILVPDNRTASAAAYFEDQTGFGGFVQAGISQPIITSSMNEDVLIIGFSNTQTRLIYTGNDVVPFNFYLINSELGSGSTFSIINMDRGVMTRGQRGYILTGQTDCARIDLEIPDQVFEIRLLENGNERMCSQRDFINEWIYFTYPSDQLVYRFPNQTLQFNYRDNSWAIFNEAYTTYGPFTAQTGFTWASVGNYFPTWEQWNESWESGSSNLLQPKVIAGNQQGFVIFRDDGTAESNSLYIQDIAAGSLITSPDHTLTLGDYIMISGVMGTVGAEVNGKIFSISKPTLNTFILNPTIGTGTYIGGGVIKKMYVPQIQSKQFPVAWDMARKTLLGNQQYLLTKTTKSQIQLLIYLSQNDSSPYNDSFILPDANSNNDALIYSTVLYTCPESTNLGLTPANINLQTPTASEQKQVWHRVNTALIGDTVQIGFTMSDKQMRSIDITGLPLDITNITAGLTTVIDVVNNYIIGQLIRIDVVKGMIELNFNFEVPNYYYILAATPTTITIDVDSTLFTPYVSGGTTASVAPINQFDEIELHKIILDVSPSQLLV